MFPLPPCVGSSAPAASQWASSSFNFGVVFLEGLLLLFWGGRELLWHAQLCSRKMLISIQVSGKNTWPKIGESRSMLFCGSADLHHCYITMTSCYNFKDNAAIEHGSSVCLLLVFSAPVLVSLCYHAIWSGLWSWSALKITQQKYL